MTFVDAIKSGFRHYGNCQGRATRSEFWYWILFGTLTKIVATVIDISLWGPSSKMGPLEIILGLGLLCPNINMVIRRLHDLNKSGWWILIAFTIIGIIPLIYWYCKRGDEQPNRFGLPPLITSVGFN